MASLPLLHSGTTMYFGSTLGVQFGTDVVRFVNDAEQRWRTRTPLAQFSFVYTDVDGYDLSVMREFFYAHKGRFIDVALSNTFEVDSADIPDGPFEFCYFDQDELSVTESQRFPNRYTFTLNIRQARPNS